MSSPLDRFRLDGRTVAITGASSGFGHHFAGVLAAAGARVVLGARRAEKIEERVEEIRAAGGDALGVSLDVCDRASLAGFLDAAWATYGGLDVLIQNAGVEAGAKTYMMIDEEDWDRVLDTNLKSVWLGAKLYTERVTASAQSSGNIVNIGSITSYRHIKGQFPYAVSKAGLTKATEILALEGARYMTGSTIVVDGGHICAAL
jgi:NAD(P)-dependent dehydrogenase (short-subunit alcohol dehydrogenase family)